MKYFYEKLRLYCKYSKPECEHCDESEDCREAFKEEHTRRTKFRRKKVLEAMSEK